MDEHAEGDGAELFVLGMLETDLLYRCSPYHTIVEVLTQRIHFDVY